MAISSEALNTFPIISEPGIKRDGARFAGKKYIDAQWCRFMRGLPRKMGGYKRILHDNPHIIRDLFVQPVVPNINVYFADMTGLSYFPIDQFGNNIGPAVDRTPNGFLTYPDNIWQFASMFVTVNNDSNIIAHAAPNLSYIDNNVESPVYYGSSTDNAPLVGTGFSVSGGVVALNPYLVMYGNFGQVLVTAANDPTQLLLSARPTSQKIVYGASVRGGTNSPSGLLWSLDSVIKMSATSISQTGIPTFSFDHISTESSILSSSGVIEFEGKFFWAGIDKFYVYNGVINELRCNDHLLWFFQNLNYQYRQKVWATKVPEYGEIWFWFPFGDSTEANAALIFNVRDGITYDTRISRTNLALGRASGYFEQVFSDPIWADLEGSIWIHEIGLNQVDTATSSIPSFFITSDIAFCANGPTGDWVGQDRYVDLQRLEPEFWNQSGNIELLVNTQQYANSPTVDTRSFLITPTTEILDIDVQGRYMTLGFFSNEIDGFYELGQTLLSIRPGDVRS